MKSNIPGFVVLLIVMQNAVHCDSVPHPAAIDQQLKKDTVVKDIPKDKQSASYRRMARNIEQLIGLPSLENGFDGMAIGIWGGAEVEKMIDLRKERDQWVGEDYSLHFKYGNDTGSLVSIDKIVRSITPRSGWKTFEDSLANLKVLTLPDMGSIFHYTAAMDERGVTIEVATPRKYRIYSYWSPEQYQKELPEARNIVRLRRLIETEFEIKRF